MDIRIAEPRDVETLLAHDRHITRARLERKIAERQVLVLLDGETFAGWLRWGLFWDEHPFMNLLFYRRLGYEDVGAFALPGDPLELILQKAL